MGVLGQGLKHVRAVLLREIFDHPYSNALSLFKGAAGLAKKDLFPHFYFFILLHTSSIHPNSHSLVL